MGTGYLAILLNWHTPLAPIQLLWLNLVTDGAPALALGTEKGDPDIMEHPPRPASEPIINKFMIANNYFQRNKRKINSVFFQKILGQIT